MQIRPVRPTDAAAVDGLLHQLGYPQDDVAATRWRIQAWAELPTSTAYVAEADGKLLGQVAVHVFPFFERTGNTGRIVALVVDEQARRRGIGDQLMTAAESFAARHGCIRLELTSADRRDDAHAFFRRRGYVNQAGRSTLFRHNLTEAHQHRDGSPASLDPARSRG
jgi:GNAT superfamily N-acetyltransferase